MARKGRKRATFVLDSKRVTFSFSFNVVYRQRRKTFSIFGSGLQRHQLLACERTAQVCRQKILHILQMPVLVEKLWIENF